MTIETNLTGRLRNTSLPYNRGLLPLFEAVVNSIHAIEDARFPVDRGRIEVEIDRDAQSGIQFSHPDRKPGPDPCKEIVGFKITDNGIGFTEANVQAFRTLDTDYKADRGCRGVGRLLWLKAFEEVSIKSTFRDNNGKLKTRNFFFALPKGVFDEQITDAPEGEPRATEVRLRGFHKRYREASRKTTQAIANNLFEHCLWYFVRDGGAPHITVRDEEKKIALHDVYDEHMLCSARVEHFAIKGEDFELIHIKQRANSSGNHQVSYCASNRLVREESINGSIPGLYGRLSDESGQFVYTCYVTSALLDRAVRSERTEFDLLEKPDGLFGESEVSFSEIRDKVIERAAEHLAHYLDGNKAKSRERLNGYVSHKGTRYRPILQRIPESQLYVDPQISDKDLDLHLHKYLYEVERQLLEEGHEIMEQKKDEDLLEYRRRLEEYLKKAEDIKKSDLASYVTHRRVILELLEKAIQRNDKGEYAREDIIHRLIMPMGLDSTEACADDCNLWIVDERLAFHDYLASDKAISSMPITGSSEMKEPDICALNVFDNPILVSEGSGPNLASIVVVEIKRPMRNDAKEGEEKDPIEQALGYLERIREGRVTTCLGRPIPCSERIPGFCYIICDITPSIHRRCRMHDASITSDGMGYFFYHKEYSSYVEVISFDRLVRAAKERNKAFFDQLGLPTT